MGFLPVLFLDESRAGSPRYEGFRTDTWHKGHKYLTLIYDISGTLKRLLSVTEERTEASLRSGLSGLGTAVCSGVQFVCSDMWKPYLKVTGEQLGTAVPVLDRFHIMQKFGKALDEIRVEESKPLQRDGYEPQVSAIGRQPLDACDCR